jgi:transposase
MLRLYYETGLSVRGIARSLSISHSTVGELLHRAQAAGLSWPLDDGLDDTSLEALLYPGNTTRTQKRPQPDWNYIHQELRRKSVTLQLLWLEYKQDHPDGYQYSQFCELYRRWRGKLDVVMRQTYRAGEKMFVDYAGETVPIINPDTGEVRQSQVFVAVLAASNYAYAEASWSQDLPSWILAHCRAFEFFGGVPEVVIPDNLRSGVSRACRYEPDTNPTYQEMAAHYGTIIIPARPGEPRDKAKVENAVQVVERWILAALRKRTFFNLAELNQAIREELKKLNEKPFQKLDGSRKSFFETLDKPALKPLPAQRYEFARWKKARVNIDYHIQVDHNYYSVSHALVRKEVDVRLTASTVEVLHKGQRVASHWRVYGKGRYTTEPTHMPAAHRKHLEWSPSRLIRWGKSIGPHTAELVQTILQERPHPEQGYRSCLGLLRLAQHYPPERMDAACRRALDYGARSYRSVKSILSKGLDQVPIGHKPDVPPIVQHANLRGPDYYQKDVISHANTRDDSKTASNASKGFS